MPGVPEPDCRVKPEVRSFNRPQTKLAGSLHFYNRAILILWIKTRLKWAFTYKRGKNSNHRGGLVTHSWARVLILAGAHGLRRNPGQSVNLVHLFWHTPRALAPLLLKEATRCTSGGFPRGAMGVGATGVGDLEAL